MNKNVIIALILILCVSCSSRAKEKYSEIPNASQFKTAVIQEIAKGLDPHQVLYLAIERDLQECGSDFNEIELNDENSPTIYYVDNSKGFDDMYIIDDRKIITGRSNLSNDFVSSTVSFDGKKAKKQKTIYDLSYTRTLQDTVDVIVYNWDDPDAPAKEFSLYLRNGYWSVLPRSSDITPP